MFRHENDVMIRQLNNLQDTVSQQSKVINTLFQVISAIGGPRGTSIRFRSGPRKLAITNSADAANHSSLEYGIDPNGLTEGVRLLASNLELKKMVLDQCQLPAIVNGPLDSSSTSNALGRVSPYLALQSPPCSSRKRPRLEEDHFFSPYDDEFGDVSDTAASSEVPQDTSNPRDESGHNGSPSDRLSDIEPSISTPIEGLTDIVMGSNEANAMEPLPRRIRGRKSSLAKLSPRSRKAQSPILANANNSPIASYWHDGSDEIDESMINDMLSDLEPHRKADYDAGSMEEVVTKCMMSPSLGQSEQTAMFGGFFNLCPEQQCE